MICNTRYKLYNRPILRNRQYTCSNRFEYKRKLEKSVSTQDTTKFMDYNDTPSINTAA